MVYKLVDYLHTINKDVPCWFGWKPASENRESYANIIVHNASATLPSEADCNAGVAALQAAYDAQAYARTRESAYEQVKEQLDQLYHDMTAGKLDATGEWHKSIKAIKDANPK